MILHYSFGSRTKDSGEAAKPAEEEWEEEEEAESCFGSTSRDVTETKEAECEIAVTFELPFHSNPQARRLCT